jgi:hypothetical protein
MSVSPRQRDLIDQLLRERAIPQVVQDQLKELMGRADLAPMGYRPIIDQMMRMPRKGRVAVVQLPGDGLADHGRAHVVAPERVGFWDGIEKAKYAIPSGALRADAQAACGDNDHLFVEVKEGREGRLYLRQLHGAPGSFSRTRMERDAGAEVVAALRGNCLEYTQLFGTLYTCCGVCGAELTDVTSRRLKLGPECRKRFGL